MSDYVNPAAGLPGFAYRYKNYRPKPAQIYKQEVTNALREAVIRNSSPVVVDNYIYDKIEIAKTHK